MATYKNTLTDDIWILCSETKTTTRAFYLFMPCGINNNVFQALTLPKE